MHVIYPWSLGSDGRFGVCLQTLLMSYIHVFELHTFCASVPETYIAQMVGWMLMIF